MGKAVSGTGNYVGKISEKYEKLLAFRKTMKIEKNVENEKKNRQSKNHTNYENSKKHRKITDREKKCQ